MKEYASITYTDSRGNVFDLMARDLRWIHSATGFHEYEWEPEATDRRFGERLRSWKKKPKEFTLTLIFQGTENYRAKMLNDFHDALEYDITKFVPGILQWEDYSIECYGRDSKTSPVKDDEMLSATANEVVFYAPNPFWSKSLAYKEYASTETYHIDAYINPSAEQFSRTWLMDEESIPIEPSESIIYDVKTPGEFFENSFHWATTQYVNLSGEDWIKDYNDGYDYAYDYIYYYESDRSGVIQNDNVLGSKYVMKIYGPAENPFVAIRNNSTLEEVVVSFPNNCNIPAGGYLVVDSRNKTAIMTTAEWDPETQDYVKINMFGARDLDYYLWNTVGPGKNTVVIDGNYKVELQLFEERSEPKWLTD